MAITGVAPAKNKIDDIVADVTMDNWEKQQALDRVRKYLNGKLKDVEALIAATPASAVNVPKSYVLCDKDGKAFAKFEDGVIKAL
jgi:ABC-type xylose transport system substrate-binding protein